jgi:hypothetical protein
MVELTAAQKLIVAFGCSTVALQLTGDSVVLAEAPALLYLLCYATGLALMGSMCYLEFKSPRPFPSIILAPLGFAGVVFFLLAYGAQNYMFPYPGAIIGVALSGSLFGVGVFVGWLSWGITDETLASLSDSSPTDDPPELRRGT